MDFEHKSPGWLNEGIEPGLSEKQEGFKPGDKPPASHFNWFWSKVSRCITELQEKTKRHAEDKNNPHGVTATQITSGTLSVNCGGTGKTTLTAGQVLVGNGTSAVTQRAITDTPASGSTGLLTAGGAYAALGNKANKGAPVSNNLVLANGLVADTMENVYYRTEDNCVIVTFSVVKTGGVTRFGNIIAYLPVGFRPTKSVAGWGSSRGNDTYAGLCSILPDGMVQYISDQPHADAPYIQGGATFFIT